MIIQNHHGLIPAFSVVKRLTFLVMVAFMFIPLSGLCDVKITAMHYFSDELGQRGIGDIFSRFEKESGSSINQIPVEHEEFKSTILEMAAGGYLPDITSYWAGARTQFIVETDAIASLDDLWKRHRLSKIIPRSIADSATLYNGKRYLLPFGYHFTGLFYNPAVFESASIKRMPQDWASLLQACHQLKAQGITPIALGAKDRWPAQFWFDYLLLRGAGPAFRARLMQGRESYTSQPVTQAMQYWAALIKEGCFNSDMATLSWNEAADQVVQGKAGMTLMGTWITGYWNQQGKKPVRDYDFFEFPEITPGQPKVVVGPVDGFLLSANSAQKKVAEELLAFLVTDQAVQETWVKTQGVLSPNSKLDPAVYSPILKKALKITQQADVFAFNYDLATTPPMAEAGLQLFVNFLNQPGQLVRYLEQTEQISRRIFVNE